MMTEKLTYKKPKRHGDVVFPVVNEIGRASCRERV